MRLRNLSKRRSHTRGLITSHLLTRFTGPGHRLTSAPRPWSFRSAPPCIRSIGQRHAPSARDQLEPCRQRPRRARQRLVHCQDARRLAGSQDAADGPVDDGEQCATVNLVKPLRLEHAGLPVMSVSSCQHGDWKPHHPRIFHESNVSRPENIASDQQAIDLFCQGWDDDRRK